MNKFMLYFDEPSDESLELPSDEVVKNEPVVKEGELDLSKPLTDEQFESLNETQQTEFFAKSIERKEEAAKPVEEKDETEDPDEDEDDKDEVVELEETQDDKDETANEAQAKEDAAIAAEVDTAPNTEKRLKDTQRAFRIARSENAELKKRLDDLEKKVTTPVAAEKPAEPPVVTLATIRPDVLQKALRENPIETMRWIADQQVKQSLEVSRKTSEDATKESERKIFVKTSEEATLKKFPVLKDILDMGPEGLEKLKETSQVKYLFGQKTAKYFKEFSARGDNEAFYNAAARAYVELSPTMIKEVQQETKRLAEKELANKRRVLGKVSVSGNKGTVNQKGTPRYKSLSDDEFMKLSPSQQMEHWSQSIDSKRTK